jgi:hypothetical protein
VDNRKQQSANEQISRAEQSKEESGGEERRGQERRGEERTGEYSAVEYSTERLGYDRRLGIMSSWRAASARIGSLPLTLCTVVLLLSTNL